jgi:hypothetical protein
LPDAFGVFAWSEKFVNIIVINPAFVRSYAILKKGQDMNELLEKIAT